VGLVVGVAVGVLVSGQFIFNSIAAAPQAALTQVTVLVTGPELPEVLLLSFNPPSVSVLVAPDDTDPLKKPTDWEITEPLVAKPATTQSLLATEFNMIEGAAELPEVVTAWATPFTPAYCANVNPQFAIAAAFVTVTAVALEVA
jgi:hypothetical protein